MWSGTSQVWAPRPLHLNFGAADPLNPVASVEGALSVIAGIYAAAGSPEAFTWFIDPAAAHELSREMKNRAVAALRSALSRIPRSGDDRI